MPRGTTRPSEVFKGVLELAQRELSLQHEKASAFDHRGIRGDERAAALMHFLSERLPDRFGIGKGEVMDHGDRRTGQLDIVIFDKATASPISNQRDNLLLPCEALFAVIEVKSTVSQADIDTTYAAAKKVRMLRPFKEPFVGAVTGRAAQLSTHRCMYLMFGYHSNLSTDADWPRKECARILAAAKSAKANLNCLDRFVILDRGMIIPSSSSVRTVAPEEAFLDTYLHLINFLNREAKRRPVIDWQAYAGSTSRGWTRVDSAS